jgi:hypothetical protein
VNPVLTVTVTASGMVFAVILMVLVKASSAMASDEVRGWLDIAPRAILRLAGARLNREQRERLYYEEWVPELLYIMREAETRPITRAIRAIGFALGLLMAARAVSRLRPPTPTPAVARGINLAFQSRLIARVAEGDIWDIWDSRERRWVRIVTDKDSQAEVDATASSLLRTRCQEIGPGQDSPPITDE